MVETVQPARAVASTVNNKRRGEGDSSNSICYFKDICKTMGLRKMLNSISGSFFAGAKVGILGLNGAGKSTFMKVSPPFLKIFTSIVIYIYIPLIQSKY